MTVKMGIIRIWGHFKVQTITIPRIGQDRVHIQFNPKAGVGCAALGRWQTHDQRHARLAGWRGFTRT